jgi:hypothetical protein
MSAQHLKNRNGDELDLAAEEFERFETCLRGAIVRPNDGDYDDARKVYNAMHDRRPALIVRAVDSADVKAVVDFSRTHDLLLAVRGGGHSVPGFGTCDDGWFWILAG